MFHRPIKRDLLCGWELFPDVAAEIEPLLLRQQAEVGEGYEPYDPDWGRYAELNRTGSLQVWAARAVNRQIVGYVVWLILRGLHNKATRFATADLVYLAPEWRAGMVGYWFLEDAIAAVTVKHRPALIRIETNDTYQRGRLGLVLSRMKFRRIGSVYQKEASCV